MSDPLARLLPETSFPSDLMQRLPIAQAAVLAWHAQGGRHDLPWQTQDPYGVWVSEIMLQQTQVSTGLVRYPRWMARFPNIDALASATEQAVLAEWEGLGYYARARNLYRSAQIMATAHQGKLPQERAARLALPGVGPSTASAIGAFAFGQREAIFDGNVERVWARWCGDQGPDRDASPTVRQRWLWSWAQAITPQTPSAIRAWTQAVMDIGATVCTPRSPACNKCPLQSTCRAYALGTPEHWPVKRQRVEVQAISMTWAWCRQGNRVAVVERPAKGIWGGLWTLCDVEPEGDLSLANGTSALSHRRIHWRIQRREASVVPASAVWVTREEWERKPLPRPLRVWWEGLSLIEKDELWA